ncbi:MAG TPA: aminodeoxychorismate synthase component I [Caulobacteraceae bacterium]|jgi:para-aminobenzoate synthetase/4-amino-4-deoxychorismate lyase|nr:aminodeoxychorismate synthase component I [Caulobacteraceae bacterium]
MELTRWPRPFVLLEDRLDRRRPARLFRDPATIVRCDRPDQVEGALRRIEAGLGAGLHAAGFLAYELGYALEPRLGRRMPEGRTVPLIWMGLFPPPRTLDPDALDAAFAALGPPPPIGEFTPGHDRAAHVAKVRRVLELIQAGDIYQANLTFQVRFRCPADPLALYGALRARQPVAHGGVIAMEDGTTVLSLSPELFVEAAGDRATTRPMKGTAARLPDPGADADAKAALAADPKQRAENLMIVDLLRNDLARISAAGSVRVPALFTLETYPTFHTLTSTVTARPRPGLGLKDKLAALFPCGSVVGAPKIRAAEIIHDLELGPRGIYTGAIGAIAPEGDMRFNVAIRTAVITAEGQGSYGVGGGVVADSDPDAEYDEALLKARVLTDLGADYGLIETFRWARDGGFQRLGRHLDRLGASAAALGFAFDRSKTESRLAHAARGWTALAGDRRVRLLLSRDGALAITDQAAAAMARPLTLGVARDRLDPGDPFLRHKTTRREVHERAFAEAEAAGLDEAVLLDRRGQVADGSRNSLFAEIGGRLVTPPLAAGALPGVLRAELIEQGRAVEGELDLDRLARADRLFIGNSLHGLRAARLAPPASKKTQNSRPRFLPPARRRPI